MIKFEEYLLISNPFNKFVLEKLENGHKNVLFSSINNINISSILFNFPDLNYVSMFEILNEKKYYVIDYYYAQVNSNYFYKIHQNKMIKYRQGFPIKLINSDKNWLFFFWSDYFETSEYKSFIFRNYVRKYNIPEELEEKAKEMSVN